MTAHGSCLCGAVRFEVQGEFEHFFLCHCHYCQKDTGSAHAANLFSSQAQLRWLSGDSDVTRFQLTGTRHSRSFCRHCGSALPTLSDDGALLTVPAGSLDSKVTTAPTAHLLMASRADWEDTLASAPKLDGLPTA